MMRDETLAFLACVLPAEGYYCAVVFDSPNPKPGVDFPRQKFCSTIEELTDVILASDKVGTTVFHGCAAYVDPRVAKPRSQVNVRACRSLWLDVDAGSDKAYPDARAAAQSVANFCARVGLPVPVFVGSGTGIHCYWPLAVELGPADWNVYANGLKALCTVEGLKADPSRTSDISSILRPPGTYHRKNGENLVQVDPRSLRRFDLGTLSTLCAAARVQPAHQRPDRRSVPTGSILERIVGDASYSAVYADDIADECGQLNHFRITGNLHEPLWYAGLGVLGFCHDGDVRAHEWSARDYTGYSAGGTSFKLDRARQLTGATTCAKFHDVNPGVCPRCPHFGRIKSPIALGFRHPEPAIQFTTVAPPLTETEDGGLQLPPPPSPFIWSARNQLCITQEDNNGGSIATVVSEHPVYLEGVQTGELERSSFSYLFRKFLPHEGWSDVIIDAKTLHSSAGISEMFGKGVVVHDAKAFLKYARHAVDEYHAEEVTETRYDQFGWKNENSSFLFGKMLYTSVGPVESIGAKEVQARSQWLGPRARGSVQAWTEAADSLFAADMEAISSVVLASFAAPLMRFQSAEEGGAIIHLFTPGSGQGKTTALMGAWTVWGTKEGLTLTNEDTRVSKPIMIGTLGNLPVIYDELRDKDPEVIKRMVVMFTEGRDRMRGTVDGGIRHTKANWQTIMLSAANLSLIDQLQTDGVDAPAFRVMELSTELPANIDKKKGDQLKKVMAENAGHAGDAYLRYLLNPDVLAWTKAALEKWTQDIWDVTRADSAHRFRVRAVGAIAVAAALVNKLGILHFQTNRIVEWLIDEIGQGRHQGTVSAVTSIDAAIGALGNFINEHYGETVVVPDKYQPKRHMVPILKPHNKLSVRYEIAPARVFISWNVFNEWAIRRQMSARTIVEQLLDAQIVVSKKRACTLGAGTDIPGAQIPCIEVNALHPAMSGLVTTVTELRGAQTVAE